jgi:uncharacterized OsmC-like protein
VRAAAERPPRVSVRSVSRQRLVQELEAREHRWLADGGAEGGSAGLGPTPLELLLGSFAARTAIGILELAREKEWAVDGVEVEVSQPAGTWAGGGWLGPEPGPAAELRRAVVVRGELNAAERRELEEEVGRRWPRETWLTVGGLRESFSYA